MAGTVVGFGDERLPARFWAKVVAQADGCWIWVASRSRTGYGQYGVGTGRSDASHRVAYKTLVGEVASGLQLDHLCRNRACCNPTHLDLVTPKENTRRGNVPQGGYSNLVAIILGWFR